MSWVIRLTSFGVRMWGRGSLCYRPPSSLCTIPGILSKSYVDGSVMSATAFGQRALISAPLNRRSPLSSGVGQLVALDLVYISGEKSQPEPGELTDLTAQYFIRFAPENLQSTARRQLTVRNAT